MRPEGDEPVKFSCKTDAHPHKGYANWWEVEMEPKRSRTREKRKVNKFIEATIKDQEK